eukprot:Tamp_23418.p1 GENE.Tamp_23418~~Tamp_23418.p1  ORF type:complete len:166 (+),score=20.93 Tamp_23418:537-1034(+)
MSVSVAVGRSPFRARLSTRGAGVPWPVLLLLFVATCSWGLSGSTVSAEAVGASVPDEVSVADRNGDVMVFRLSADGSRVQLFVDGVLDIDNVETATDLFYFVRDEERPTKMDELTALLARVMTLEKARIAAEKVAGQACAAADKKVSPSVFACLTRTPSSARARM